MSEWTLQHPWLTFFVLLFGISAFSNTLTTIFGKSKQLPPQQKQPQVGIAKLVIQRQDSTSDKPDDEELN